MESLLERSFCRVWWFGSGKFPDTAKWIHMWVRWNINLERYTASSEVKKEWGGDAFTGKSEAWNYIWSKVGLNSWSKKFFSFEEKPWASRERPWSNRKASRKLCSGASTMTMCLWSSIPQLTLQEAHAFAFTLVCQLKHWIGGSENPGVVSWLVPLT